MGAVSGELKVGLRAILTQTAQGLAGEVGCVRGQALPCMEGATRLSRKIFPKKKKTLGAIWGIPLQQQLQPPLHPATHPGTVCTSTQRELRLQASPRAGCPATRRVPSYRGVCPSTGECPHLISEGAETQAPTRGGCPVTRSVPSNQEYAHPPGSVYTSSQRELRPQAPGRVRIKEGSARTPIARRRPTIKKVRVEDGNTRILPGRGNPPTKQTPTDKKRRR